MTNLIATKLTDRGMVRPHNEDFVDARSLPAPHAEYEAWVVADGMGGHQAGEVASKLAVGKLLEYLAFGDWTDPAEALRRGFMLANERVHEQGRDMGTTLVAALVHAPSGNTWLANVGDSRAYLVSGDRIDRLTHDHSVVQARVDAGQMTQAEADRARGKNVLTAAIGPEEHVTPAVSPPFALRPGERLLLCSDGLHTMLDDATIAAMVRSEALDDLPARLVAAANAAGGRDNISVLIGAAAGAETTVLDGPRPLVTRTRKLPIWAAVAASVAMVFVVAGGVVGLTWNNGSQGPAQTETGTSTPAPTATPTATIRATETPTPAATAPPTAVPPTTAPPTAVPPTTAPPTAVPPTTAPPTAVPPTTAPPTAVPPTTAPPTNVPPTAVPPKDVPPRISSVGCTVRALDITCSPGLVGKVTRQEWSASGGNFPNPTTGSGPTFTFSVQGVGKVTVKLTVWNGSERTEASEDYPVTASAAPSDQPLANSFGGGLIINSPVGMWARSSVPFVRAAVNRVDSIRKAAHQ